MAHTIVALATGPLPSALALVRLSGPSAFAALSDIMDGGSPAPRRASVRTLRDLSGAVIDEAVVTCFPGPNSFTGEDLCEITAHGGVAVLEHLIDTLLQHPDVRLAEPGEYTRRAFETGRLDLTEAEAIADLIAAETPRQKAQALDQLGGALSAFADTLRAALIEAQASLEVLIDFPDEGDVDPAAIDPARVKVSEVCALLETALADNAAGERIREGMTIALVGAPNAGKSTLLNALARRDAAIVTDIPGTTRDVIDVRIDIAGIPVTIRDTAGLRDTADAIEAEGVRRAERAAAEADLVVLLIDATTSQFPHRALSADLTVATKIDRAHDHIPASADLAISAKTGEGMPELLSRLETHVSAALGGRETALITRARHRQALTRAFEDGHNAASGLDCGADIERVAEDMRAAVAALDSLVGRIDVEAVLGSVFSRFCIGK